MKRRAKVLRMLRIGVGTRYGQGWSAWVYYDDCHHISGAFSVHPTHAAALAHAIEQVYPKESR